MILRAGRILALGLAAVGGIGTLAYVQHGDGARASATYVERPVARRRIVATLTATGTLTPLRSVQVGSQVSGRIFELRADFNSEVKKDDVLAIIDARPFGMEVARARASLASARANVVKAEAAYLEAHRQSQRAQQLLRKGVLAQADADTAAAQEKSAHAQRGVAAAEVAQADATVRQAQLNLAYTTISSPIAGVVTSRNVDVGQTVAASLQAPTLFTIAEDLRAMEVHTSVAESDVAALGDQMAVTIAIDAFPGERFTGNVRQIRNAPSTVQNVVTYDAVVRVDNRGVKLRPGMTANVSFIVSDRKDVLAVPSAALRFTPPGATAEAVPDRAPNRRTVWVDASGEPRAVEVTVGASDGRFTAITDGELREGDLVIVGLPGDASLLPATRAPGQSPPGVGP